MGRLWTTRSAAIAMVSETIGYKSGLALSSQEIRDRVPEHSDIWDGGFDDFIGIRGEVFARMVALLLHRIGSIPSTDVMFPGLVLRRKYGGNPDDMELLGNVIEVFTSAMPDIQWVIEQTGEAPSLDPVMEQVLKRFGPGKPIKMALDYVEAIQTAQHADPWSDIRRVEWQDVAELSALFECESLESMYGSFFDQRYVDYLEQNFESIDEINWRKFEGLTAEFFDRKGFRVEIGPGRNDDGVDVRVWPEDEDLTKPPAILVQCKRQRNKVGKVVLKALWADIQAEGASSGLIVTTNALSPGARKTSTARSYPISEANRSTLRHWIREMRSPGQGVFLGE